MDVTDPDRRDVTTGVWGSRTSVKHVRFHPTMRTPNRNRETAAPWRTYVMAQVVQQVVAVEAPTQTADLDQPRPHPVGVRINRDCPGATELCVRKQIFARRPCHQLVRRRAPPQVPPAVQRRGQEHRQVSDDGTTSRASSPRGGLSERVAVSPMAILLRNQLAGTDDGALASSDVLPSACRHVSTGP